MKRYRILLFNLKLNNLSKDQISKYIKIHKFCPLYYTDKTNIIGIIIGIKDDKVITNLNFDKISDLNFSKNYVNCTLDNNNINFYMIKGDK